MLVFDSVRIENKGLYTIRRSCIYLFSIMSLCSWR